MPKMKYLSGDSRIEGRYRILFASKNCRFQSILLRQTKMTMNQKSTFKPNLHFHFGMLLLLCFSISFESFSQIPRQFLEIAVVPDREDWTYITGQNVEFSVSVTQSGRPVAVENVRYVVKEEKMDPIKEGSLKLKDGKATIE